MTGSLFNSPEINGVAKTPMGEAAAEAKHKGTYNLSLLTIELMVSLGMDPLQNQIGDEGAAQNAQSQDQGYVTGMGSFLSWLEASMNKDGDVPQLSTKAGYERVKQFAENYEKFFKNADFDSGQSETVNQLDGSIYIPGMSQAQVKALMNKYWGAVKEAFNKAGITLPVGTGNEAASGLEVYMAKMLQTKIDSGHLSGSVSVADLMKAYNPANDSVVANGADGLWKEFNTPVIGKYTLQEYLHNFIAGHMKFGGKGTPYGYLKGALDTLTVEYMKHTSGTKPTPGKSILQNLTSDTSTLTSYFQTQTQENTQLVQQLSSELTSEDQIGQSVISSGSKEMQNTVGNMKTG